MWKVGPKGLRIANEVCVANKLAMKETTKAYLFFTASGAAFGITTSLLSGLSNELVKAPLGFSPLTLKNVLKVGILSGLTATGLFALEVNWEILTKIGDKIKQL